MQETIELEKADLTSLQSVHTPQIKEPETLLQTIAP